MFILLWGTIVVAVLPPKTISKQKGRLLMNCKANESIRCTVNSCKNHCSEGNYCSLNTVQIGTHEAHPTQSQCVDCESFVVKN